MLFWKKRRAAAELDALIDEMKINLANNYKSLAHDARKKLGARTEQLWAQGKLTEKEYKKYSAIYTEYTEKLHGYHH